MRIFNFQLSIFKEQKGYTLIELLVALAVAVAVVSAMAFAVVSALSNAEYSRSESMASQYAQQGMEIMRQMRDSNYSTFQSLEGTYCLDLRCTQITSNPSYCWVKTGLTCGQNVNTFQREITISGPSDSPDCNPTPPPPTPTVTPTVQKVSVTVSWSDGKCPSTQPFCHQTQLISCLSDYTVVSTPGINETPTPTPSPTPVIANTPTPTP